LLRWAFSPSTAVADGIAVLEFVRDRVGVDPDFGEVIDEHTRGERVSGTDVEVVWTFDPARRSFRIITPFAD
jgi:hypothetical protein